MWEYDAKLVPQIRQLSYKVSQDEEEEGQKKKKQQKSSPRTVRFKLMGDVPLIFYVYKIEVVRGEEIPEFIEADEWFKFNLLRRDLCEGEQKTFTDWFNANTRKLDLLFKHGMGSLPKTVFFSNQRIPATFFYPFRQWWNTRSMFNRKVEILDLEELTPMKIKNAVDFEDIYPIDNTYFNTVKHLGLCYDILTEGALCYIWNWRQIWKFFTPSYFFKYIMEVNWPMKEYETWDIFEGTNWQDFVYDMPTYLNKICCNFKVLSWFGQTDGPKYEHLVMYMNHWLCVIVAQGNAVTLIDKDYAAEAHQDENKLKYNQMRYADMNKKYAHCRLQKTQKLYTGCTFTTTQSFEIVDKKTTICEFWLTQPQRREFKNAHFIPCGLGQDPYKVIDEFYGGHKNHMVFNSFFGWNWDLSKIKVDLENEGLRALFYHLHHIICAKNPKIYNQFENWLTWLIKYPYKKTEVCWFICGDQGAGKSLFVTLIGTIFGSKFTHLTKANRLHARFNGETAESMLILVDEGNFNTSKSEDLNNLKAIITESKNQKENKGVDTLSIRSFCNVIVCSNERSPIKMEVGYNRRYQIIEVDSSVVSDFDYFDRLVHVVYKDECLAMKMFWKYLLDQKDDKDITPPRNFEPSDLTVKCQLNSLESIHKWWLETLFFGRVGDLVEWSSRLSAQELYDWCFIKDKSLRKPGLMDFIDSLKVVVKIVLVDNQTKIYAIPPLEDCRQFFLWKMAIKHPWERLDILIKDLQESKQISVQEAEKTAPLNEIQKKIALKPPSKKRKQKNLPLVSNQKKLNFSTVSSSCHVTSQQSNTSDLMMYNPFEY